jgi:hypothetical protein
VPGTVSSSGFTYDLVMGITVMVHCAEEGGYWAEVPAIPGAAHRAKHLRNYFTISMKQLRVACQPTFERANLGHAFLTRVIKSSRKDVTMRIISSTNAAE